MDFSQYTQENQRVIQGMKDTLKALINKFGGTVDAEKIDQYPTLVDGIEVKGDAGDITYDNAESGLHSNNVQDAIDEVYKAQTSVIPENIVLSDDAELGEPFIADSDTLEGHPASYFAVAEETSAALNQKADLTFSNIVEKTTALENIGAMPKTYTGSDIPVSSEDSTKIKDALGNKADLTLSNLSDYQKALSNIGGKPNDNILINNVFVGGGTQSGYRKFPINVRGKTVYQGKGHHIVNWFEEFDGDSVLEIHESGIIFKTKKEFSNFAQNLDLSGYEGKKMTLSFWLSEVSENMYLQAYQSGDPSAAVIVPAKNGISTLTFDVIPNSGISTVQVQYRGPDIAEYQSVKIYAAKLEQGDKQTLGWEDDSGNVHLFEIPNFGEMLEKSQRYLLKLGANSGWGFSDNTNRAYLFIPLPTTMRTTPVWSGTLTRLYPFEGNAVTEVRVGNVTTNMAVLTITGTGFTNGNVYSANEIDGFLSAEL